MPETPIELGPVTRVLSAAMTGRLPEARGGNADERRRNFLSRALAAYALHKLAGCTLDEAAAAVVDGGGDGGIDAVYHAPNTQRLWVVQAKYISTGRGEPDLGSVSKFKDGIEALLRGRFAAFEANGAWRARIPDLKRAFDESAVIDVRAVLVYSGTAPVAEDRLRMFEMLRGTFGADYLDVEACGLTTVHDWVTAAEQLAGVPEVQLTLYRPGWSKQHYEVVYGLVALGELASLYQEHGRRLIAANIRAYKGRTDVNEQIFATARDEPEHFAYLNNGLTAYCERLEVHGFDRADADRKRIRAFGMSIVNGAQTLGALSRAFPSTAVRSPVGYVLLRLISLRGCADEHAFAERITRSTNYQNQIGAREFVTLDEQQERIAKQLLMTGVTYHYKQGEDTPDPDDSNFTLDEATTACACLAQDRQCDLVARVIANRQSLWDLEPADPRAEDQRSRYQLVFRAERSAHAVWRGVQAQRVVKEVMQATARSEGGPRKAFFENCRWLVLNLVYHVLRTESGEALSLTAEEKASTSARALELAELLWSVCEDRGLVGRGGRAGARDGGAVPVRHFRSIFSNPTDCRLLRDGVLGRLAGPAKQAGTPVSV